MDLVTAARALGPATMHSRARAGFSLGTMGRHPTTPPERGAPTPAPLLLLVSSLLRHLSFRLWFSERGRLQGGCSANRPHYALPKDASQTFLLFARGPWTSCYGQRFSSSEVQVLLVLNLWLFRDI